MPQPRVPTAELEMRGAFKKDPQRRRFDPETLGPIRPEPPAGMSEREKFHWAAIVANAPIRVLTNADVQVVQLLSELLALKDELRAEMPCSKLNLIRVLLGALGMTPSDRSKVTAIAKKETGPADPWAAFDNISTDGEA